MSPIATSFSHVNGSLNTTNPTNSTRAVDVPPIMNDAIAIGAKVVWMQEGIRNDDAAREGEAHGLRVVMDTCIRSAHRRMIRERAG